MPCMVKPDCDCRPEGAKEESPKNSELHEIPLLWIRVKQS